MSTRGLVVALRGLQSVLCICPCCGELFRLSEGRLFYASPPRRTWFDDLEREREMLERAEDRFEEERQKLQEMSRQSVERELRRALRQRDPVLTPRGYYPKDARPLLDPVDFVVFDGMNIQRRVRAVVLLDHVAEDRGRERVQASLERALERGNVGWSVVRVGEDGQVRFTDSEGT